MKPTVIPQQIGVLWLYNNLLYIYTPTIPQVLSMELPPTIYREMEIIQEEELYKSVIEFVATNKIPATQFIFVIAAPFFTKDIVGTQETPKTPQQIDEDIQTYLEHVPFETVVSKKIPLGNGYRVIAANADMYETFQTAFAKAACKVSWFLPKTMLDASIQKETVLSVGIAQYILKNSNAIQQLIFVEEEQKPTEVEYEVEPTPPKKKEQSILPIAAPVFVILIGLLIFVYIQSNKPTPKPTITPTPLQEAPSPTISLPTPSIAPSASSSAIPTGFSVHIIGDSKQTAIIAGIKGDFSATASFQITTETSTSLISAKTLVLFSSRVPQTTRQLIMEKVKKAFPEALQQETTDAKFDVTITLAKSP